MMEAMLQVQEDAVSELECVICLMVPRKEAQVFSCQQHHLFCSECNDRLLESCPLCKENFTMIPPTRNRLAEKMIEKLN